MLSTCNFLDALVMLMFFIYQLENLRNSSEFQKDTDEETKRRNTFDPDESKEKSNKRRDRLRRGKL